MKKLRFQPTFASLSEAELEELAAAVQRETYDAVRERICKPRSVGGLDLHFTSNSPLVRLHDKKNKLDLINARLCNDCGQHKKLTLADLNTFTSGEKRVPEEIHDAIMGATYDLVTERDNTPHQLLALQRLADFPARVDYRDHKTEMDNFRKHITTERLELQKRALALREKALDHHVSVGRDAFHPNPNSTTSTSRDAINDTNATTSLQNHERGAERGSAQANISSDVFHPRPTLISRDAINKTHTTPADPHPQSNPNNPAESLSPSSPSSPPSASLISIVDAYNIRRAEEYWAWRRGVESLRNGETAPQSLTEYRHCPCGKPTPCPDHENETYGEFPGWFWTLSPHLYAYEKCLTWRKMPYRDPVECIPQEFDSLHDELCSYQRRERQ